MSDSIQEKFEKFLAENSEMKAMYENNIHVRELIDLLKKLTQVEFEKAINMLRVRHEELKSA